MKLRIRDLRSGYGSGEVLRGVSIDVPGGAVAVLGRNGAGKTTLLQTVMGFIRPSGGTVMFEGRDIGRLAPESIVRLGVSYAPQDGPIFARLTVRDNLVLAHRLAGASRRSLDYVYDLFPVLRRRSKQVSGTLSGGERKFLALGRALIYSPRLLILDEPTEGVWPSVVLDIAHVLSGLKNELSILLVEQNLSVAMDVADYVYVLERGEVLLSGSPAMVAKDPRTMAALVG
jgi:branched-chain amino acid transport system ATP-binding protein